MASDPRVTQSASITAQNTFTTASVFGGSEYPTFSLSISGTWVATVTLQRSFDGGSTYLDVKTYTSNAEELGEEPEDGVLYRVGVKTGDFTSGTVVVRLGQ